MPSALTVPPAFPHAPSMTWRVRCQISFGSCSTQPGLGKICSCSSCSVATTSPSWLKIMHRVLVVPWSSAATYSSAMVLLSPPGLGQSACEGVRGRAQQQVRGRRTRVLVVGAALAEVAGAPLARHERDRGFHALLSGIGARGDRVGERAAGVLLE